MSNEMVIKVFKMDYEFLLKNYLNPELWHKSWTLFEYKTFKITLCLYSIRTKDEEIYFEIKVTHRDPKAMFGRSIDRMANISLKIDDIQFLKRKINSAIWEGIQLIEKQCFICESNHYMELTNMMNDERDKLKKIAEEFLEEHDVTNEKVKDAYIDAYVDAYENVYTMRETYVENQRCKVLTDFYLIWLESLENDKDKEIRIELVKDCLDEDELKEVLTKIEEYKDFMETEEFTEEAKSKLEEV